MANEEPKVAEVAEEPKPHEEYVQDLVKLARAAANKLASVSTAVKDHALVAMAESLVEKTEHLLDANREDLEAFEASKVTLFRKWGLPVFLLWRIP